MSDGNAKEPGLLLDLDGVIYEGEYPVAGAAGAIDWLVRQQIAHLFVSNTTSRPRDSIVERLAGLGIRVDAAQILTPPVAAASWLHSQGVERIAACVPEATLAEFSRFRVVSPDEAGAVDAVVVGDLGEGWDFARLNGAFRLLMAEPRPHLVALGMTRYWKAADGLRLDTAPFVVALAHASGAEPVVLGKPAVPFFQTALAELGRSAEACYMIGDDLRVDVGGAQSAGLRGILVRTGKYRGEDSIDDIRPLAVIDSIADLPACWQRWHADEA